MDLDENNGILWYATSWAVHVHHTLTTYQCCNLHNTQDIRNLICKWRRLHIHKHKHTHTQTNAQTDKRYTHR